MAQALIKSMQRLSSMATQPEICQLLAMRFKSSCKPSKGPRCSKENLRETQCSKDKEEGKQTVQRSSMWLNPECCIETCKDVLPRFDDLYYKASNKAKREYQQTWVECPKIKFARKPLCKYEKVPTHPPLKQKRCPAKEKPKTACPVGDVDLLTKCREMPQGKCPKISMKGCRPPRTPPKCLKKKEPSDCQRVCTPFPAFSECKKDPLRQGPPVECFCLTAASMCDVWRLFHRRNAKS